MTFFALFLSEMYYFWIIFINLLAAFLGPRCLGESPRRQYFRKSRQEIKYKSAEINLRCKKKKKPKQRFLLFIETVRKLKSFEYFLRKRAKKVVLV
jgi:hypothetical protein